MDDATDDSGYGLSETGDKTVIDAPELSYLPRLANGTKKRIALIGCGGISEYHLRAYRDLGLHVVALCDVKIEKAEARRVEFFPEARVCTDYRETFTDDVEVIDAATHVEERGPIMEGALYSGKHVLSQKPFVTDLDEGQRLVRLAEDVDRWLAVNQNGRWAPHFAYMQAAIRAGALGDVGYLDFSLEWDHSWTAGTVFDEMRHLVLLDFGIHWFDMCACVFDGREPVQVSATTAYVPGQKNCSPMAAHVIIDYPGGQATISFNGAVALGQQDATTVAGSTATFRSDGPSLSKQHVSLYMDAGVARPALEGTWFTNGFQGAMCDLLNAIAGNREPRSSGRDNLKSLALCFAAMASADDGGRPKKVGGTRRAPV